MHVYVTNYKFDIKVVNCLQKYRIDTPLKKRESEYNFWTYEEFNRFIEVVNNDFDKLIFTFLYYTGLRIGEFSALNWNDINLKNKTLSINKSLSKDISGKPYTIVSPKTKKSIRVIDLDDNLIKMLKEHYNKEKNVYGFNKEMFIFGNVKYTNKKYVSSHIEKYLKKANVKRITPHGLDTHMQVY